MFEFVRRNRIVLASGSLLLLSLLLLSAGARAHRQIDPVAGVVLDGMRPLQNTVTTGIGAVAAFWRSYIGLVYVSQENARLRQRVRQLEQQAVQLAEVEQTDKRLDALLQFRSTLAGPVQAAEIIGRDPLPWFSTVIINKGRADGVYKSMAVLSPFGVVGQTTTVSAHAAQVLLITDHNSGVDAVVQRTRARGIVEGAIDGGCVMKYIQRGEDIAAGDRIVTSGLDGLFPKGLMIGEVTHVTRGTRGLLQVADVQPSAPLDRIEEVLLTGASTRLQDQTPMGRSTSPRRAGD